MLKIKKKRIQWNAKDKKRAKAIIKAIAIECDGVAKMADKLGLESRQVLTNWSVRGRVPIQFVNAVLELAPAHINAEPRHLHPDGRYIKKETKL